MSFKHNKKRNVGLVFEFLIRHMGKQMMNNDAVGCRSTYSMIRRYFGSNSPLSRELEFFDAIKKTRGASEAKARKVLEEVRTRAPSLNGSDISTIKSSLIKEINHTFGKDFFSAHRLSDYRLLASIQLLLDSYGKQSSLNEGMQKIQLEEALINYMMSNEPYKNVTLDENVDDVVCVMATKRFNEKYGSLNVKQKELLEKYMRSSLNGDDQSFISYLRDERTRMLLTIKNAKVLKEVRDDNVMRERLVEAESKLISLQICANEDVMADIMLYQKLEEELKSNE